MKKDNLNILLFKKSGCCLPWAIQSCRDALLGLDHSVEVIDIGLFKDNTAALGEQIKEIGPDFILCNNHMGLVQELTAKLKIPHACWLEDDPFYWVKKEDISQYKMLFVYDKSYIPKLKTMGFNRIHFLPLCTDPRHFKEVAPSGKLICDISFAGGSYYKSFEIIEKFLERWGDPKIREISDEAIKLQSGNLSLHIYDILEAVQERHQCSVPFADEEGVIMFGRILAGAASSIYRQKMIDVLDGLNLHLYGDDGWGRIIEGNNVKFLGSIPHEDLAKLFVSSKINLNFTTTPIKTTLTRRPFDILACGGFVLSDYRQDIERLLEIDKEIVCFRNEQELKEKINYFLGHPQERKEIVQKGQMRVLREHTYAHRMERLINVMREIFG